MNALAGTKSPASRTIRSCGTSPGLAAILAAGLICGACTAERPTPLIVASTTSTQDSGLLDVLVPAFERTHPEFSVKVIAVGSGEALAIGARGDADMLLVHSPRAESTFVAEGHGTGHLPIMRNDFVLIGPPSDPAGVAESTGVTHALLRIAASGSSFISRGDHSGTHARELRLWKAAGVIPHGDWYDEVGQGMGATLQITSERGAYTLTDRATFLTHGRGLKLKVLVSGDPLLRNVYSVIQVTGAAHPEGGRALADWLRSPAGRRVIAEFGREKFGGSLFTPES